MHGSAKHSHKGRPKGGNEQSWASSVFYKTKTLGLAGPLPERVRTVDVESVYVMQLLDFAGLHLEAVESAGADPQQTLAPLLLIRPTSAASRLRDDLFVELPSMFHLLQASNELTSLALV